MVLFFWKFFWYLKVWHAKGVIKKFGNCSTLKAHSFSVNCDYKYNDWCFWPHGRRLIEFGYSGRGKFYVLGCSKRHMCTWEFEIRSESSRVLQCPGGSRVVWLYCSRRAIVSVESNRSYLTTIELPAFWGQVTLKVNRKVLTVPWSVQCNSRL